MSDHLPYPFQRKSPAEMQSAAAACFERMNTRRSIRDFSPDPVPRELIETAIRTASTAPSGAHRQPWQFVVVGNAEIKSQIRVAAEAEEREFYEGARKSESWLKALEPFDTTWQKPFLETAPWIVVVFEQTYRQDENGAVEKNYYVKESVGIACGMFVAAIHEMGLATLTHTPNPMAFLSEILERPKNEKPYILFPIGYPTDDATVPNIRRKSLEEVATWVT